MISLFTGVAGLELGLDKPCAQIASVCLSLFAPHLHNANELSPVACVLLSGPKKCFMVRCLQHRFRLILIDSKFVDTSLLIASLLCGVQVAGAAMSSTHLAPSGCNPSLKLAVIRCVGVNQIRLALGWAVFSQILRLSTVSVEVAAWNASLVQVGRQVAPLSVSMCVFQCHAMFWTETQTRVETMTCCIQ